MGGMLGVLGGMGPLASAEFMRRLTLLTPAGRDQDHVPAILWSDPRVPDRIAGHLGTGESPLPALLRGLRGLQAAGCGAVVMPCNTAHGWHGAMQAASPVPILHIVDAAEAELARLGVAPGPVGLMGTAGTLAMRLYQDRLEPKGWRFLEPAPDEMAALVLPAIAGVKVGDVAAARAPLAEMARRLQARGAQAVVLACTEMPLALGGGPALAVPVCDTVDALARAAIRWALAGEGAAVVR